MAQSAVDGLEKGSGLNGWASMKTDKLWILGLAILLVPACDSREPRDISEDQLNHFAGIAEHDHPSPRAASNRGDGKVTVVEPEHAERQPVR